MIQPFLVNGYDGTTPLQAYCSVMTSDFMIVDTIYPHPHISICVRNIDGDDQFGDNACTRNMAIKEVIMLNNIVVAVKHYYHRYKVGYNLLGLPMFPPVSLKLGGLVDTHKPLQR